MIEAVGLTKRFGGRTAVEDVSFRVGPGEVVGFLGPNGAGKSTTMRLLLRLLRPDAGQAVRPMSVGYLPEVFSVAPQLSVRGTLRFLATAKRAPAGDVDRALDALELTALARRPVGRLSRGQRQRLGLAQTLLGSPPAYVLDEPTSALDPKQVVEARALIRGLAADGGAVLVSTHVLAEAASTCDRVVIVVDGRVVADEPVSGFADLEARFLRVVS